MDLVVALVLQLCPNPYQMGYKLQGENVSCIDYYVNDIVNNPHKYDSINGNPTKEANAKSK